jgi:tetratricopeptide (TPR) repeat protein
MSDLDPSLSATDAALPDQTGGAVLRPSAAATGDAASSEAMARFNTAVADLRLLAVQVPLNAAVRAIRADDWKTGGEQALKALEIDERCGVAWHLLAVCREKAGDFKYSIACYETALALLPDHGAIANDLGRLAYRLGQLEVAGKLFAHFLARHPGHPEGANNLACVLRDQHRFDEAVETLRTVIYAEPDKPILWNTLGTVLNTQGEIDQAIGFYDEALRLDPAYGRARYNRGNARLSTGDVEGALQDTKAALDNKPLAGDAPMMRLARALALIASGDAAAGWDFYESRLEPNFPDATAFLIDRPRWTAATDVAGKSMLVVGEQGLGDEILFANVLPDLIEALGPEGRLTLAVEPRLVPLFQQSFPQATVGAHATYRVNGRLIRAVPFLADHKTIDLWTPMASLPGRWRRSLDDFPATPAFLKADPERVAYWRTQIEALGEGPKVGLVWKSLKSDVARRRFFSAFDQWKPVLTTPGVCFVNLQYGDCSAELAQAKAAGIEIWDPPINLKDDLAEVAALACALDLVIGPANTTTNIAAACGNPVWQISTPGSWPRLGTDRYPWYPTVRVFVTPALNQWDTVMAEVAEALVQKTSS